MESLPSAGPGGRLKGGCRQDCLPHNEEQAKGLLHIAASCKLGWGIE